MIYLAARKIQDWSMRLLIRQLKLISLQLMEIRGITK